MCEGLYVWWKMLTTLTNARQGLGRGSNLKCFKKVSIEAKLIFRELKKYMGKVAL